MSIYGQYPFSDALNLLTCDRCNRVFKIESVLKHEGNVLASSYYDFLMFTKHASVPQV